MASYTERDEILFGVVSKRTALTDMVDLKIGVGATVLTPPSISLQHLPAELSVESRIQSKPRPFGPQWGHDALRNCDKFVLSDSGSNEYNRWTAWRND
jgi:hypothetical protein